MEVQDASLKTIALLELYILSVILFDFRWGNRGCERLCRQKNFFCVDFSKNLKTEFNWDLLSMKLWGFILK